MRFLNRLPTDWNIIEKRSLIARGRLAGILFLICLYLNPILAFPQARTSPPKKGRTLVLESVRKIVDDGKELIFKAPRNPWVDEEGALFFSEAQFLYKYKDGQQIFRVGKWGQGPGECQYVYSYAFLGGTLYVQASRPTKFLSFSSKGIFLKDWAVQPKDTFWQMFSAGGELYGLIDEMVSRRDRRPVNGYVESEFSVNRISPDHKKIEHIIDIPILLSVDKLGNWQREVMLGIAVHDPYLFVLHSAEYSIDRIDLRSGLVDKTISRKFVSTKDEFDIIRIIFQGDRLWAITSEGLNNGGDRLVDVYDINGNLIDAFYLHLPDPDVNYWIGTIVVSRDGILSIVEENKLDGFLSIGQYRIR